MSSTVRRQGPSGRVRPRRRGRTTREGKAFVFVTMGVGVAAVNTGNNLLYLMLGLMMSSILLSMVMSELTLRRIRVHRSLPRRAFAGSPCIIELSLENEKRFMASLSLEVEDVAAEAPTERRCYFLKVGPRSRQVATYRRTPPRRGLLRLTAFRVTTRYPFGLIEKSHVYDGPADLVVYPALTPIGSAPHPAGLEGSERPAGRMGPGTETAGVRAYRSGDAARAIHWRRTASLGQLVVRERERDEAARLTIALDNARPTGAAAAWEEGYERALSEVASLVVEALCLGATVDVVARGRSSPVVLPGSPADPILRFLALLDAVPVTQAPRMAPAPGPRLPVPVRAAPGVLR